MINTENKLAPLHEPAITKTMFLCCRLVTNNIQQIL